MYPTKTQTIITQYRHNLVKEQGDAVLQALFLKYHNSDDLNTQIYS